MDNDDLATALVNAPKGQEILRNFDEDVASDGDVDLAPDQRIRTSFPGCADAHPLSNVLSVVFFPCVVPFTCCGCFQMPEREHAAVMYYGKYYGSVQEPGIHFLSPCGLDLRRVSTATQTMDMNNLKVLDLRGNPVIVSAVITFQPTSAKKAKIDVQNPWPAEGGRRQNTTRATYMQLQAMAVLKQVTSQFPYDAPPGKPSLQTEGRKITETLVKLLQSRVAVTGARILSFDLTDLSYAPEIAAHMLVRQQASALVDARKLIVDAAVDMTRTAITSLEDKGQAMDNEIKNSIARNLLTVICSNDSVKPVVRADG